MRPFLVPAFYVALDSLFSICHSALGDRPWVGCEKAMGRLHLVGDLIVSGQLYFVSNSFDSDP